MYKLFYVIYNSYFKDGSYKNDIPPLTVGGIFTVMWPALIFTIHLIFFNDTFALPSEERKVAAQAFLKYKDSGGLYLVIVSSGLLTYFLFYHNQRHVRIYHKYKDNKYLNTINAKYIAFGIAFAIILSPIFTPLIKNKIFTGAWV